MIIEDSDILGKEIKIKKETHKCTHIEKRELNRIYFNSIWDLTRYCKFIFLYGFIEFNHHFYEKYELNFKS